MDLKDNGNFYHKNNICTIKCCQFDYLYWPSSLSCSRLFRFKTACTVRTAIPLMLSGEHCRSRFSMYMYFVMLCLAIVSLNCVSWGRGQCIRIHFPQFVDWFMHYCVYFCLCHSDCHTINPSPFHLSICLFTGQFSSNSMHFHIIYWCILSVYFIH